MPMSQPSSFQGASRVRHAPAGWRTRSDVEFLNALHPRGGRAFPEIAGVSSSAQLQDVCLAGFRAVVDQWEATLFQSPKELSPNELRLWLAIRWRTLKFGKLFEKIPERHFINGIRGENGELIVDSNGYDLLPPTGITNRQNLDRAAKGLLKKKLISRFRSERHEYFGYSYVYAPLRADQMLLTLFSEAHRSFTHPRKFTDRDDFELLLNAVNINARRLLDELAITDCRSLTSR